MQNDLASDHPDVIEESQDLYRGPHGQRMVCEPRESKAEIAAKRKKAALQEACRGQPVQTQPTEEGSNNFLRWHLKGRT